MDFGDSRSNMDERVEDSVENVAESGTPSSSTKTRFRRMGLLTPLAKFSLSGSSSEKSNPSGLTAQLSSPQPMFKTPPSPITPPVPPRSPLRPSPKSVASFSSILEKYQDRNRDSTVPISSDSMSLRSGLTTLLQSYSLESPEHHQPELQDTPTTDDTMSTLIPEKLLPSIPSDTEEEEGTLRPGKLNLDVLLAARTALPPSLASTDSSTKSSITLTASIPKRIHALRELLNSERAYASDLAFIRETHIPLALGYQVPFHCYPITPPSSSSSSSRTLSVASDSSSISKPNTPMTPEDVKIIFNNIPQLAMFADILTERLEEALGDAIEGGKGEDCVGKLFLEKIPEMEPLYSTYITKHPLALKHLNALPQTPALAAYNEQTRLLASSVTHAWDLPSLLIKPVQRLLKYSLLLTTILDETPDEHPDKAPLREARNKMEAVASRVNEGRRRMELVKEILTGKAESGALPKKKLSVGKSASNAALNRMKSTRLSRSRNHSDNESLILESLEEQLAKSEEFMHHLARGAVQWCKTVSDSIHSLRKWATDFGHVIGLTPEQPSEAFDYFLKIIDEYLMPLCTELNEVIHGELHPELAKLLVTLENPKKLIAAMHALEPLHHQLVTRNMNDPKNRPVQSQIDASKNFLALRAQLLSELPRYFQLLDKGIVACIIQFAQRQTEFWGNVRDRWAYLWDALRMEGETNAGAAETLRVWWERYRDMDELVSQLKIVQRKQVYPSRRSHSPDGAMSFYSSLRSAGSVPSSPLASPTNTRHHSIGSIDSISQKSQRSQKNVAKKPSAESLILPWRTRPQTPEDFTPRRPGRSNTSPVPVGSHSRSGSRQLRTQNSDTASLSSERRGRSSRSPSFRQLVSEGLKAPLRRSSSQHSRRTPESAEHHYVPAHTILHAYEEPNSDSIDTLYTVSAIHEFRPPENASYSGLPFFKLRNGDVLDVIEEAGHPSKHPNLPLSLVREGQALGLQGEQDHLFLVRNSRGQLGWALASYLIPLA